MKIRSRLITGLAALTSVLAIAGPAHATVSISCADMKFDSSIDIVLGAGPVPNVFSVTMSVGGREFSTEPGLPGEPVSVAQAFDDGELFRIDLVDDQATRRVAAIRLLRAEHDTMPLQLGFLQIEDEPPIGISCEGP
ncbi:MAG: hypothetical protein COA37_03190 [Hoeflea sp.]|uniref:hypothetical protein n=1 Tax=Hoeflea sp. TaxID=1940281 RepID=UPI000C111C27|nr:hypothetical protein [Hoeflea sp.]PHR24773.1 MAG: hypothetical protein COA37_03190 [Hoeflea sp.]|tara:strand:- start:93256 stop:93666 length:411 start_codon:yes stop_codon:yes gene_type:complete